MAMAQVSTLKKNDLYPHYSEEEYARRFEKTKKKMAKLGLDCLVVGASSSYVGGRAAAIHYLSNYTDIWGTCNTIVFPLKGDPMLTISFGKSHFLNARELTGWKDIRSGLMGTTGDRIVDKLKELKLENGKIGITEADMHHTTVPVGLYNTVTKALPNATFQMVPNFFEEFWNIKSPEEIEVMQKSGYLCDDAVEAAMKTAKPGVKEWEVVAAMKSAILKGGGDIGFVMIASTSMYNPDRTFSNSIPSNRLLKKGDIIVNEIGARFNNYETQLGVPICLGEPTDEYKELWDLTYKSYARVVECLRPGKTAKDVNDYAAALVREKGYQIQAPFAHGLGPGWVAEPLVFMDEAYPSTSFAFKPGMTICAQAHPVHDGERFFEKRGIFVAATWLVTQDKPRCLHRHPVRLEVV
jgi:Xaa-Pro aminopeptidase